MEADQVLFDLAGLAATSEELRNYLVNTKEPRTAEIRALPQGPEFNRQLDAFLEEFGWRTETWQISAPTWKENPRMAFRSINRFLVNRGKSPEELVAEAAIRRDELKATLMRSLSNDDSRAFEEIVEGLSQLTRIREERAFWQLSLCGHVRHQVLIRGERLRLRGDIDESQDVFFLLPEEIEGGPTDRRALVRERKAEHEYWISKTPPMRIGAESVPMRLLSQPKTAELDDLPQETLRGIATSKGVITGRAVVARGFEDASRLKPGEVLVAKMTAPPWTPLFAVAGGVVTETGSILSHTAITAREYGIPCVVAVPAVTKRIPDGALIRVDGTKGLIEIL
jgi:pyruvate,water dikinase